MNAGLDHEAMLNCRAGVEPSLRLDVADRAHLGLTDNSHQFLLRWGVSREFSGFGSMVSGLFRGRQE
jgi:hypothetical protein